MSRNALAVIEDAPRLPVAWRERPFSGPCRLVRMDVGARPLTIAEIVASIDAPDWFKATCEARINDALVPRGCWHLVRPRVRAGHDVALSLTIPLGAQKNPLASVLSIAVLLAAVAVSQGSLLAAWIPVAAAPYAGAAIGVVGSLAISALVAPPPQPQITQGTQKDAALSGNQAGQGIPVPRVIGTHLVYPQFVTPPLIEVVGDTEVAEATLILAGPHQWNQILFDGVDAASVDDVIYETFEGLADDPPSQLVPRQSYTTTANIEVSQFKLNEDNITLSSQYPRDACIPVYHNVISRKEPDEFWITHDFVEGLGKGDASLYQRAFRCQFRQQGGTWQKTPQVTVGRTQPGRFKLMVCFKWQVRPNPVNDPPASNGFTHAYNFVAGRGVDATYNSPDWTAESYFGGTSFNLAHGGLATTDMVNVELFTDRVIFYLDPATYPKDTYEFKIVWSSVGKSTDLLIVPNNDHFTWTTSGGAFQTVRTQADIAQKCVIVRHSSIVNQDPCPTTKFAKIAIKATGRSISSIGANVSGLVYDTADDINWDVLTTSSNPATNFREILGGMLGAEPVPPSSIDDDTLFDWRQHCIDNGYEVNAVIEGKSYLDCLDICASAGYARRTHNQKWGVFIDKDRSAETPVQIFGQRNARDISWKRTYIRRPSGLRAFYNDSTDSYRQNSVTVYDDDSNPDASRLEQVTYDGLVTAEEAETRARFDLLQTSLRYTFYNFLASHDAIVCQRGSMIGVQHDILIKQAGAARIKNITRSGGNITGLTLDGSVPVDTEGGILTVAHLLTTPSILTLGAKTGLAIRLKGGNGITVAEITGASDDDLTDVTFVTPFADPGTSQIDLDCLCVVGPLGSEYKRLIVTGIVPQDEMWATMSAVDEAPPLWS